MRLFRVGLPLIAALLLAIPALSQTAARGNSERIVTVAGQQVAIDAQTGKLRQPTPEEARKLAEGMKAYLNRSTVGLTVREHPNGMKSVNLQGRFQSIAIAQREPDGKITQRCVTSQQEAKAALRAKKTAHSKTAPGRE